MAKLEKVERVWKNYEIKFLDTGSGLYEAVEFNVFNRMMKRYLGNNSSREIIDTCAGNFMCEFDWGKGCPR